MGKKRGELLLYQLQIATVKALLALHQVDYLAKFEGHFEKKYGVGYLVFRNELGHHLDIDQE